jgi:hypothetical protein
MIKITTGHGPSYHSPDILEQAASGDWSGLGVDHTGNIAAVQIAEVDVADHREDVLAEAALYLCGGTVPLDAPQVAFRQSRD